MKWFGRKAAPAEARPPLARAWIGLGWIGTGDWPQGYEAQLKTALLANPVAQRAMRLVSEAAGSAALVAHADEDGAALEALKLVQRRTAGQGLIETLAAHLLLHGNGYVQIGHGRDGRRASMPCDRTGSASSRTGWAGRSPIAIGLANGTCAMQARMRRGARRSSM